MNSENFYAASAFFNGLFALFVVYYISMRNRQNPINRSFLAFGVAVAGWSLIYALWGWADNAQLAEFYLRRHMMFEAFIPAAFFHFTVRFSGKYERLKLFVWVSYVLSAFYSIGMLTPLMIAGVKNVLIFKYWPTPGPLLFSHLVYFFILVTAAFTLLIHQCFTTQGADRQRACLMLLASSVGFGGGCINWFLWFDIPIPPTTNFFVGVMFAITAYAIVRHGLMDIDAVVEMLRYSRASSLGILASSMNHELRNPLYISKGRIETQLDAIERNRFATPEQENIRNRETLEAALAQLGRATDIMQKFADFVRPDAKPTLKENILVRETISDVLGLIKSQFQFQKIKVDDQQVNGTIIHANRRQFEEILFNLMVNACQAIMENQKSNVKDQSFFPSPAATSLASPNAHPLSSQNQAPLSSPNAHPLSSPNESIGDPCSELLGQITLSAKHDSKNVTLEIADTGPGVSKENQRKIFEPFHSTKGLKGSGLGLYIVKQLVERNGGKIDLKSKVGQGTVFSLRFQAVAK